MPVVCVFNSFSVVATCHEVKTVVWLLISTYKAQYCTFHAISLALKLCNDAAVDKMLETLMKPAVHDADARGYWTTRRSANSRTSQLADWSSSGLDISWTGQLSIWAARGLDKSQTSQIAG